MEKRHLPIALLWVLLDSVQALQTDVIVDDADPRITYTGSNWTAVANCGSCGAGLDSSQLEDGTYHMTQQAGSTAEFGFTGIAVSVYGVVVERSWRDGWGPSHVTFTIDGTQNTVDITNLRNGNNIAYNRTFFNAQNLPNVPHTLSIQTIDSFLFVLDSITYTTNTSETSTTAATSSIASVAALPGSISSTAAPTSSSSYVQSGSSLSTSTQPMQPAALGGIVAGVVGALLLAAIVALWYRKQRANRSPIGHSNGGELPPAKRIGRPKRADSGSSFGGLLSPTKSWKEEQKWWSGVPIEYAYSGAKQLGMPVPLGTMQPLSEAANHGSGGGGYQSPFSTYASSSSFTDDGRSPVVHAITTDTPQPAQPMPFYESPPWPQRPNTGEKAKARPFSTGSSTLEAEGVLERVMRNHSNISGHSAAREEAPPPVVFQDHPFRTMNF